MGMEGNWSLKVRGACSCGLQESETASERAEEKDCVVLELSSASSYVKGKDGAGSREGLAKQRR